jgi:ANTAR domain/PAS fold
MSSPTISRRRPMPHPLHTTAAPSTAPRVSRPPESARVAGRYRYDLRTGGWWWSPEMFQVLDLHPEVATPSTELLVARQHAEDGPRVLEALDASRAGEAFALEVRTTRSDGEERLIVLLGEPQLGADGEVSAVEGVCVDLTDGRPHDADEERVRALQTEVLQLRTAMASRASIEQAKGILMLLTTCSDQGAFDLLAHISSHTHRKVREVAQSITESAIGRSKLPDDVSAILRDACPPSRHPE